MIGSVAFVVMVGILPELLLVGGAVLCLGLVALRPGLRPSVHRWIGCIVLGGAFVATLLTLYGLRMAEDGVGLVAFGGGLVIDRFAMLGASTVELLALLTLLGSATRVASEPPRTTAGFHSLVLVSTAAAILLAAEREMIAMAITVQVVVLGLALLCALSRTDRPAVEAAVKQVVLGAAGSALLLYGFAILYGISGTTDLAGLSRVAAPAAGPLALGTLLVLVGLGALIATVPFHHAWVQVSGGVPTAIAGFTGSVGVVGGVAAFLRITAGGMGPHLHVWIDVTTVVGSLTVAYAALMSLRTGGARRLIALLTLAQAGFLLTGLASLSQGDDRRAGVVALIVYLITASVSTLAAVGAVGLLEHAGVHPTLDAYRGVGHRSGPAAHLLAVGIAGLAGLPPLAVFVARALVMESVVVAGYAWVAAVAAVATLLLAVSAVRFLGIMYASVSEQPHASPERAPRLATAGVAICAAAVLLLGALVQPLLAVSSGAAGTLILR